MERERVTLEDTYSKEEGTATACEIYRVRGLNDSRGPLPELRLLVSIGCDARRAIELAEAFWCSRYPQDEPGGFKAIRVERENDVEPIWVFDELPTKIELPVSANALPVLFCSKKIEVGDTLALFAEGTGVLDGRFERSEKSGALQLTMKARKD